MMIEFTVKGVYTVFKILQAEDKSELDLVQNWGESYEENRSSLGCHATRKVWDKFGKENLCLSGFVVRGSLGPHLLGRIISLAGANASGPELFLTAVFQVCFMTTLLVRSYINQIGGIKLTTITGENVTKLGGQINEGVIMMSFKK